MSLSHKQNNIDRFNAGAHTWDAEPRHRELSIAIANAIIDRVPLNKNMSAMEYGCGTGLVSIQLAPHVQSIVAADISEGMIDVLSKKLNAQTAIANISPLLLDRSKEPRIDGHFDVIFTSMTLHHIDDIPSILKHFHRLINAGGFLAIADLSEEDGSFHSDPSGVIHHGFNLTALKTMLHEAGLSNVSTTTVHTIHKTDDKQSRAYPIFLCTSMKPLPDKATANNR